MNDIQVQLKIFLFSFLPRTCKSIGQIWSQFLSKRFYEILLKRCVANIETEGKRNYGKCLHVQMKTKIKCTDNARYF